MSPGRGAGKIKLKYLFNSYAENIITPELVYWSNWIYEYSKIMVEGKTEITDANYFPVINLFENPVKFSAHNSTVR